MSTSWAVSGYVNDKFYVENYRYKLLKISFFSNKIHIRLFVLAIQVRRGKNREKMNIDFMWLQWFEFREQVFCQTSVKLW